MSIGKFIEYDEFLKEPFEISPYDVPDEFETEDEPLCYYEDAETPFSEIEIPPTEDQ